MSRFRSIAFLLFAGLVAPACSRDASGASSGLSEADIADEVAQRIELRESPGVFAAFVMLNAAGYDDESRGQMHPVRRAVRGALSRRLPEAEFARSEAFMKAHGGFADLRPLTQAILATSGPPNFSPAASWGTLTKDRRVGGFADLPDHMRAFVRAFPVDSLYRTQQTFYRSYLTDYALVAKREVATAVRYARVRERTELTGFGEHPRTIVIPNLLFAYDRSLSVSLDTVFYSVEGPRPVVGFNPHEFVHAITRTMSFDTVQFAAAHRKAAGAYTAVRARNEMAEYPSLAAFVDECLVRAIVLRYAGLRDDAHRTVQATAAADAAKHGFVLVPYFFEQLDRYEAQGDPLRSWYPRLFERLDGARELARWRDSLQ